MKVRCVTALFSNRSLVGLYGGQVENSSVINLATVISTMLEETYPALEIG